MKNYCSSCTLRYKGHCLKAAEEYHHCLDVSGHVACEYFTQVDAQARLLAVAVKTWWEEHKCDTYPITDGEYAEDYNTFDKEPEFVTAAKTIIGDWEK